MDGIINLNKPPQLSSARAVSRVKRLIPRGVKIGHAGTLDPFATGVLLLLIGRATKSCESLMDQPKEYVTTIRLGATTETDDPEKPPQMTPGAAPIPRIEIEKIIPDFIGVIQQRPPIFSAMKIGGRRAYKLARSGQTVTLKPREVRVDEIDLLDYTWPDLKLRIACGRGTYIRAIGRDLGEKLGVGGYLTDLSRTRVGKYRIEDAQTLEGLTTERVAEILAHDEPRA
jgi:tRNA pseudouridine55 synthase